MLRLDAEDQRVSIPLPPGAAPYSFEFDPTDTRAIVATTADAPGGSGVWSIDLADGSSRRVFDGSAGVRDDGRPWIKCTALTPSGVFYVQRTDANGLVRLARVRLRGLARAAARPVHTFPRGERITRVQVCPADDRIISYTRVPDRQEQVALPAAQRARAAVLDTTTGRAWPAVVAPAGQRACEEFWSPDGHRLFFHLSRLPGWAPPGAIASVRRDGSDLRHHLRDENALFAIAGFEGCGNRLLALRRYCATQQWLRLDLRRGHQESLTGPYEINGSAHPANLHLSPSGRHVLYTSDHGGMPQVRLLELPPPPPPDPS